jgi:hypothetical protein
MPVNITDNASLPLALPLALDSEKGAPVPDNSTHRHDGATVVEKMKKLEEKIKEKILIGRDHLLMNGPLPANFASRFAQAVSSALGIEASTVTVLDTTATREDPNIVAVSFLAPVKSLKQIEDEAADSDSKLAQGDLKSFLVAKDDQSSSVTALIAGKPVVSPGENEEATPVQPDGIDIDTAMPYGDLEPFGREDTAQELTEDSIKESDGMVDQLERAEVSEEKRAVFRALTRLRGAAITSFDGIARSQTGNIDEYNKVHQWRQTHPLHHLADEESDVSKWAFPDNADF